MTKHRGCNKQVSEHATDVSDEFNDRALVGHDDICSQRKNSFAFVWWIYPFNTDACLSHTLNFKTSFKIPEI
jgi:hypothetical protein